MIVKKFTVDPYKWKVVVVKYPGPEDIKKVKKLLQCFKLDREDYEDILNSVRKTNKGQGAHHIFNTIIMKSMLILYDQKSKKRHIVSICHEKRHLEDKILSYCGIDDDEAAAYLAGFLAEKLL